MDKLVKLKKLADAMYYAAQYLTTDASRLHKAMDEYHNFIIHEWREETVSDEIRRITMTNQEAIKYLQQLYPNGGHCWLDEQRIEAIGMAVKALQEEPVSEDLEEAVNNYIKENGYDGLDSREEVKYIANHFANWQKEQMMVNTADATIGLPYENKDGGYTHLIDVSRPLPVGNNKIAIIFKED